MDYIEDGLRNSKDGAATESDAALWYYILLSGVIVLLTVVLHRFWYMEYGGMAYHDITLFIHIHIEQHLPAFVKKLNRNVASLSIFPMQWTLFIV